MLTDTAARQAKGKEKPYKLPDAKGLYLYVTPGGFKSWRMKYRFGPKEKLLTFGPYPEVTLAKARDQCDAARRELREGRDPGVEKKKAAAASRSAVDNSFETVAREWYALNKPRWGEQHAMNVIDSLEDDLFPDIGKLPMRDVTEALLLESLQQVERRGAIETAHRIRQRASEIFAYAAAKGMRTGDPASVIKTLLLPKPKATKQPALTSLEECRQLIRDVEAMDASPITKLANRYLALTAVRSAVQRHARWPQIEDLGGAHHLWRIPPSEMKLSLKLKDDQTYEHMVPLPRQASEVIEAIRPLTGRLPYVFPNARHTHRPMSENGVRALIIRAADGRYHLKHCPHGWRTSFSTIMNEWRRKHGRPDDREVIDLMLAHVAEDKVEGAYNRAAHLERRRELAQIWADMLLEGMPPAAEMLKGKRC